MIEETFIMTLMREDWTYTCMHSGGKVFERENLNQKVILNGDGLHTTR